MKTIILSILLGFLIQTPFCQEIDTTKLNAYLDTLDANNKFMGTVSVTRDGEPIYSKSGPFQKLLPPYSYFRP